MSLSKLPTFITIILFFSSCNNSIPDEVITVLRSAGNNALELKKVIDHYKNTGEKRKLKAAYFLIANMGNKYAVTGENLQEYFGLVKQLNSYKALGIRRDSLDKLIKIKIDSLENIAGGFNYNKLQRIPDATVITSEFLIKNIEHAFMVWQKPWAQHLSFHEFCEFVLPYRLYNEPLSNWREHFYKELIVFEDSVKDKTNPKEFIEKISNHLYKKWNHLDNFKSYNIYPDPITMAECNGGLCDHRYYLITMMYRSIGLPVSIETTPQWTNYTGGHSWNVFVDKDGRIRPFNGAEDNFRFYDKNVIPLGEGTSICTKVFRQTFALQKESLPYVGDETNAPSFFRNRNIIDVTENYEFPNARYVLRFDDKKLDHQIVYLCVFNYGYDINFVAWAKVKNKKADFGVIGTPAFYIPVIINNNRPEIVHAPMVFSMEKKNRHYYKPDLSKKAAVRLYRKFNFSGEFLSNANLMKGGRFQGSNIPDFSDATDLAKIEIQAKAYEELPVNSRKSFRYLRYLPKDSTEMKIAEIEFWGKYKNEKNEHKLEGIVMGHSPDTDYENDAVFKNAFDENIRTNLNAKSGSWVGLDLGQNYEAQITNVWFLPRNNYNEIEKNHLYELFYLDDQWKSLGRQVAVKHYLIYDNVPIEALLLLKNLTDGKEERIFMYDVEKQEQVWW